MSDPSEFRLLTSQITLQSELGTGGRQIWAPIPVALSSNRFAINCLYSTSSTLSYLRIFILDATGAVLSTTDFPYTNDGRYYHKLDANNWVEYSFTQPTGSYTLTSRRFTIDSAGAVTLSHTGVITEASASPNAVLACNHWGDQTGIATGTKSLLASSYNFAAMTPNFGAAIACLDFDGNLLWATHESSTIEVATGTSLFVSNDGTKATMMWSVKDGTAHQLNLYSREYNVSDGTPTGAVQTVYTTAYNPTGTNTWFEVGQFLNPYLTTHPSWMAMRYNGTADTRNIFMDLMNSTAGIVSTFTAANLYNVVQQPFNFQNDLPFIGYGLTFYEISTAPYNGYNEDGPRVITVDPVTGVVDGSDVIIPHTPDGQVGTEQGTTPWPAWYEDQTKTAYDPASSIGVLATGWTWQNPTDVNPHYDAYVWMIHGPGGTAPVDTARVDRTFSAATDSTPFASARMFVRDVALDFSLPPDVPIDSTLTDTPGKITAVPTAPIPIPAMAVYPGFQTQVLTTDGTVQGWGPAAEPGLVPTLGGFPKAPAFYISGQTLASTTGQFLSGLRDLPENVDMGTQARFLAKDWGGTSVAAIAGSELLWSLTGTGTLVDYQYRQKSEIFDRKAISLSPGDKLVSDFTTDVATEMTVSLAVFLRQPLRFPVLTVDTTTVDANDVWCLTCGNNFVPSRAAVTTTRPTPYYLTLVLQPPVITAYISTGTGAAMSFSVRRADEGLVNTALKLGQIAAEAPVASMEILEVNLDLYARSSQQVERLNAVYGSVYGQG
jgi:hypothetical protein